MNTKSLIVTIALTASTTGSLAQEFVQPDKDFISTRTRAEVVNEVIQSGTNTAWHVPDHAYPVLTFKSARTREDVTAELKQALDAGTAAFSETTYPTLQATGTPKSRAQVRAELDAFIASGGSVAPTNH